ncbi:MAG: GrpB family protein [Frankiales bacterium]|nr:GrpB family protein [Frankiales bacterium]
MRDDTGREVAAPSHVARVVSLVPSLTEALAETAPGLLVGVTDWCTHPADLTAMRIGGTKNPAVPSIRDLGPDLVVANAEENRAVDLDALREAGIAVWVTAPETVPQALTSLDRMLTACGLGRPVWLDEAAEVWAEPFTGVRRSAVVPIWRRPWMAVGRDTFTGDVLGRVGIDNVLAGSAERYPTVRLPELPPHDLVVLPDEPYAFTAADGPECFAAPAALVSGRHLTWYGPSLVQARELLTAQLAGPVAALDEQLEQVLVGGLRPVVVELAEADAGWPAAFDAHRTRIVRALGDAAGDIQHIGSTAVPGLAAKPIIDVQLAIAGLDGESWLAPLQAAGYVLRVHEPGHAVVQDLAGSAANVHLHEPGDPALADRLRLRDLLRRDPRARRRYEAVKRALAGRSWPDINHYAEAKGPVIRALLDGQR